MMIKKILGTILRLLILYVWFLVLNSSLKKTTIPIKIGINPGTLKYESSIIESIDYLNQSVFFKLFELNNNDPETTIVLSTEHIYYKNFLYNNEAIAFYYPLISKIVLKPRFETMALKKVLIAHELLHSLGMDHIESEIK